MDTALTQSEFFALFKRSDSDLRWLNSADSDEFLNTVLYLVRDPLGVRR